MLGLGHLMLPDARSGPHITPTWKSHKPCHADYRLLCHGRYVGGGGADFGSTILTQHNAIHFKTTVAQHTLGHPED